jgi:hypothetical protein
LRNHNPDTPASPAVELVWLQKVEQAKSLLRTVRETVPVSRWEVLWDPVLKPRYFLVEVFRCWV